MRTLSFEQALPFGAAAESNIALYLRRRGFTVFPAYEKILDEMKGPQLFTPTRELIAPDLLCYRTPAVYWIEAKHKAAFSWHRLTSRWVTGVDAKHYADYLAVAEQSPWPVWLFFLHRGGQAKDSPPDSPAGLFGNELHYLSQHINHRHDNWGSSGMVYWALDHLRLIAPLADVIH